MMRPNPAACIAGSAAWVQARAETRLTASSFAQSSGVRVGEEGMLVDAGIVDDDIERSVLRHDR